MTDLETESGLILLKCRGCNEPTIFRLKIHLKEEGTEYTANRFCRACENGDSFEAVFCRELEPKLVENQRLGFEDPDDYDRNAGQDAA